MARTNASHNTTLGYLGGVSYLALNGPNATFAGEAVNANSILARYALYGDTDLDGGVSINDFNLLAANFGKTMPTAAAPTPLSKGVAPAKH